MRSLTMEHCFGNGNKETEGGKHQDGSSVLLRREEETT